MMRVFAAGLVVLVTAFPAVAATRHHQATSRHHVRSGEVGMPITAERDSIRINSVGEVITQPVPMIQKEKDFDSRARRDLSSSPQQTVPGKPPAPLP